VAFIERSDLDKVIQLNLKTNVQLIFVSLLDAKRMLTAVGSNRLSKCRSGGRQQSLS
jgi:hypothetical protein